MTRMSQRQSRREYKKTPEKKSLDSKTIVKTNLKTPEKQTPKKQTRTFSKRHMRQCLKRYSELDEQIAKFQPLIKEHKECLDYIKGGLKERKKHQLSFEEDGVLYTMSFKITKMTRVNTALLPDEIKKEYAKESEIWRTNLTKTILEESSSSDEE